MEGEGQRSTLGVDWTLLQKQAYKYEGWVRRRERSEQRDKVARKVHLYELLGCYMLPLRRIPGSQADVFMRRAVNTGCS